MSSHSLAHRWALPRWWWAVLIAGVASWVLYLVLDLLKRLDSRDGTFPFLKHWMFNADADRSFAETTGYLFMLVGAGALILIWRRTRGRSVYGVLAAILIVIVADDSLTIHERGGYALSNALGWSPAIGMRAQDFGELAIWGMIAAPLGILFCIAWYFSSREARRGALAIVACLCVMLFFAAVVDAFGPMTGSGGFNWHYRLRYALRLFEFSGEYLSMVALCLVALRLAITDRAALYAGRHGVTDPSPNRSPTS